MTPALEFEMIKLMFKLSEEEFVIHIYMKNGDTWKTVRRCKKSLSEIIECILTDKQVERFSVKLNG